MTSDNSPDLTYVWIWLPGATQPIVAGALTRDGNRFIFNYGRSYLEREDAIPVYEPELPLVRGAIFPAPGLQQASALRDAAPDACSGRIMGHYVHSDLRTINVAEALKRALKQRKTSEPLIHHSDRGIQYCSAAYQSVHEKNGLTCSMTDGYDCYQNAMAERVNGILKTEFLLSRPADLEQARKMVKESIEIYNGERPHLSLNYKTPDEFHQAF